MPEKQERVEVKRDVISLRENYGTKFKFIQHLILRKRNRGRRGYISCSLKAFKWTSHSFLFSLHPLESSSLEMYVTHFLGACAQIFIPSS